jgi:lysophospholipase L1-like esterase
MMRVALMTFMVALGCSSDRGGAVAPTRAGSAWFTTWVSAQQLTEPHNMPPAPLAGSTLRQVLHVALGGERLRVAFSNEFGDRPLTLKRAHVARSTGLDAIDPASDRALWFDGRPSLTIAPGASATSDELAFVTEPLTNLALSIAFDDAPPSDVTGHPGSRTTSFLEPGDHVSAPALPDAQPTDHWYFMSRVDVLGASASRLVVTLGDSITDGRGSNHNHNDRWPNLLNRRLLQNPATPHVGVLNQGIGGNHVIAGGLGPSASARFERDVLGPLGVRWVIVLEGINDLSGKPPPAPAQLIAAYRKMIAQARARGLKIYGGTILPFGGAVQFTPEGEAARQAVNGWIRSGGVFDGVIDFDRIARDPSEPTRLSPAVDGGDHLHPSAAGYAIMAAAIDLELFRE